MKPKVLIFIDWFLPGYKAGGPIKSVANIVRTLQREVDFSIVTSNADFGNSMPYDHIKPNEWILQAEFRIIYLDNKHQKHSYLKRLMQEEPYDLIYFNSLFSIKFTLLPLLIYKYSSIKSELVVAPRGMLGQGALELKKHKKRLFLSFAKILGIFNNIRWHASTSMEAAEIKAEFGKKATVQVATNIASLVGDNHFKNLKTPHNTAFFFLSRISPKKNLLTALLMLSKVSSTNKVKFDIIGPVEDEKYWQQQKMIILQQSGQLRIRNSTFIIYFNIRRHFCDD